MNTFLCGGVPADRDRLVVAEFSRFLRHEPVNRDATAFLDVDGNPSHDVRRQFQTATLTNFMAILDANITAVTDGNTARDLPYHGVQHLFTTTLNAYDGALAEGLTGLEIHLLLTAALYHDVDHTGGPGPDSVNVAAAVRAFHLTRSTFNAHLRSDHADLIEQLIAETVMPHVSPTSKLSAILQDADLLQTLEPDGPRFVAGLREELGGFPTDERSLEFIRTAEFNTDWGRDRRDTYLHTIGAS